MHLKFHVSRTYDDAIVKDIERQERAQKDGSNVIEIVDPFWWIRLFVKWLFLFLMFYLMLYIIWGIVLGFIALLESIFHVNSIIVPIMKQVYPTYENGQERSVSNIKPECDFSTLGPCNGDFSISLIGSRRR